MTHKSKNEDTNATIGTAKEKKMKQLAQVKLNLENDLV
jgi:hypothetical protein